MVPGMIRRISFNVSWDMLMYNSSKEFFQVQHISVCSRRMMAVGYLKWVFCVFDNTNNLFSELKWRLIEGKCLLYLLGVLQLQIAIFVIVNVQIDLTRHHIRLNSNIHFPSTLPLSTPNDNEFTWYAVCQNDAFPTNNYAGSLAPYTSR